jgi:hypothetical protein
MKTKSSTRTVVKHSYISAGGTGKSRAKAHANYVAFRPGKDKEQESRKFFDATRDDIKPDEVKDRIDKMRHKGVLIHKLILSPGEETVDMREFTRSVLKEIGQHKGGELDFWAVVHDNTDHQHAHIIVAGKDKEKRRLRLTKKDYDFIREVGDEVTDRIKVVELEPEKEIAQPSKLMQFFEKIGLPVKRISVPNRDKSESERKDYEVNLIGEPVTSESKLKQFQKEERRKKRIAEKRNMTITVYNTFVPDEYTSRSPKEELLNLVKDYDAGFLQDQISRRQRKQLGEWIDNWDKWQKESEKVEKIAARQSHKILRIDVDEGASAEKTYSRDSKLEQLQILQLQNEDGEVVLSAAEEKALKRWVDEKRRQIPVQVPLKNGDVMTCLHTDDLEFLEKTARISKNILPEADYKRLWFWIFQKRVNRDINKQIEVSSPLGKLVYSRSDALEHLQVIAEKYRAGEKWVTDQVNKDEYDRLCRWIKEKYEREPQIW